MENDVNLWELLISLDHFNRPKNDSLLLYSFVHNSQSEIWIITFHLFSVDGMLLCGTCMNDMVVT